jgi:hypothetical protein
MGVNAVAYAMGPTPKVVDQISDYGRKIGTSFQMIAGVKRPTFNSIDSGSLEVRVNTRRVTF